MNRYNNKDLEIISKNIEILYSQGMGLINIFELLEEIPVGKVYKSNFKEIARHIKDGEELSEAFSWYDTLYPEFFVEMIALGEKSGEIIKILKSLAEYYNRKNKTKEKIISVITYPVVVLIAMLIMAIVFILFIVPSFNDVYESMGIAVPRIVEICSDIGWFVREKKIVALLTIICWSVIPVVLIYKLSGNFTGKSIEKFKIMRLILEHKILTNIEMLIKSGVNLSVGLELCLQSLNGKYAKGVIEKVHKEILKGETLTDSLSYINIFSNYTLGMIRIGEETGTLDNRLGMIVSRLDGDINKYTERIVNMIQPIIIIGLSVVVLIVIVTIVLPMFNGIMGGIS